MKLQKNINNETQLGNFREDLYHRLNVFEINIKPLNQRISDIPLLIRYFSKKISENYNLKNLENIREDTIEEMRNFYFNERNKFIKDNLLKNNLSKSKYSITLNNDSF